MKRMYFPALLLGVLGFGLGSAAAATFTFSNNTTVAVPDGDSSGAFSTITVNTGTNDFLLDVQVSLNLSATAGGTAFLGDLYVYLTNGSKTAVLINRPGRRAVELAGYDDNQPMLITLGMAATNDIHNYRVPLTGSHTTPATGPVNGLWLPDARATDPGSVLDTDARTASLNALTGTIATTGNWQLFVADLSTGATHKLDSWSITLNAIPEPCSAVLGLLAWGALVLPRRRN